MTEYRLSHVVHTDEPRTKPHPVYPGGPPCQPNCPGSWSTYHEGYADGYAIAEAARPVDDGLRIASLEAIIRECRSAVKAQIGAAKTDKAMGRIRFWCRLRDRIDAALGSATPRPVPSVEASVSLRRQVATATTERTRAPLGYDGLAESGERPQRDSLRSTSGAPTPAALSQPDCCGARGWTFDEQANQAEHDDGLRAAERDRIRAGVEELGGLEYGAYGSGQRYLNTDFVDRLFVLGVIDGHP